MGFDDEASLDYAYRDRAEADFRERDREYNYRHRHRYAFCRLSYVSNLIIYVGIMTTEEPPEGHSSFEGTMIETTTGEYYALYPFTV